MGKLPEPIARPLPLATVAPGRPVGGVSYQAVIHLSSDPESLSFVSSRHQRQLASFLTHEWLGHRVVKRFVQGHTAEKWQG